VGVEAFGGKVEFFGANPPNPDQLFCGNDRLQNSTFYQETLIIFFENSFFGKKLPC
jgi:hypothetical protein